MEQKKNPDKGQPRLALLAKMLAVQKILAYIQKKGRNQKQDYAFVRERDVVSLVRDALHKHKLIAHTSFFKHEYEHLPSAGKQGAHIERVWCTLTIIDTETGEEISWQTPGSGTDYGAGDKAVYKAITGASKYAFTKGFLIETGEENDPEYDAQTKQAADGYDYAEIGKGLLHFSENTKNYLRKQLLDIEDVKQRTVAYHAQLRIIKDLNYHEEKIVKKVQDESNK